MGLYPAVRLRDLGGRFLLGVGLLGRQLRCRGRRRGGGGGFAAVEEGEITEVDFGRATLVAVRIGVDAVAEFAVEGDTAAFFEVGGHRFGLLAPGNTVVPFGPLDPFAGGVAVAGGSGDGEGGQGTVGGGHFLDGIGAEVTDKLDVITNLHGSRITTPATELKWRSSG